MACVGLVCVALSSHLRLWQWGHDSVKSGSRRVGPEHLCVLRMFLPAQIIIWTREVLRKVLDAF